MNAAQFQNHPDYCPCRCCRGEAPKAYYTVKPYDWQSGGPGGSRRGTVYQIVENRTIATSKCHESADKIVKALNEDGRLRRQIEDLKSQIDYEQAKPKGVPLCEIRAAFEEEKTGLRSSFGFWETARKTAADAFDRVFERLDRHG